MEYISIGKFRKAHGLKGELRLDVDEALLEDIQRAGYILVSEKNGHIPYFIEYIRSPDMLITKLEGIDGPEQAATLSGREIFLKAADVTVTLEEDDGYGDLQYGHLRGYAMLDQAGGLIGEIADVLEYPMQEIALVTGEGDLERLIPLNETFIAEIDGENRRVLMQLPDGMLDIL